MGITAARGHVKRHTHTRSGALNLTIGLGYEEAKFNYLNNSQNFLVFLYISPATPLPVRWYW
jgi:hypothetical protein